MYKTLLMLVAIAMLMFSLNEIIPAESVTFKPYSSQQDVLIKDLVNWCEEEKLTPQECFDDMVTLNVIPPESKLCSYLPKLQGCK